MWWFDINRFNINDPTTFGHIKDGKDGMALTIDDLTRANKMWATRNRIKALNDQLAQLRADQSKLNIQLELELSTLRKLETEDKAAAEQRALEAKVRKELEDARIAWPSFRRYEDEILKVLEADKARTDAYNSSLNSWPRKKYQHTLRSAYVLVRDRYTLPSLKFFGTPYGDVAKGDWVSILLKPANPVPVVDVTKVGTRVRYNAAFTGVVIPRPAGRAQFSQFGEGEYVYVLLDKSSEVWGCYKKNLKAL